MFFSSFRELDANSEFFFQNAPTYERDDRIIKHQWYFIPSSLTSPTSNFLIAGFFQNYKKQGSHTHVRERLYRLAEKYKIDKDQTLAMAYHPKIVLASFDLFSKIATKNIHFKTISIKMPDQPIYSYLDRLYQCTDSIKKKFEGLKNLSITNLNSFLNIEIPQNILRLSSKSYIEISCQDFPQVQPPSGDPSKFLPNCLEETNKTDFYEKNECVLLYLVNHLWKFDQQQGLYFTYLQHMGMTPKIYEDIVLTLNQLFPSELSAVICENQLRIPLTMFNKIREEERNRFWMKDPINVNDQFTFLLNQIWYFSPRFEDFIFTEISSERQDQINHFLQTIDFYLGKINNVHFIKNDYLFISRSLLQQLKDNNLFPELKKIPLRSFQTPELFQHPSTILEDCIHLKWFKNLKNNEVFFVFPFESIYQPLVYFEMKKNPLIKEFLQSNKIKIKQKKNIFILPSRLFEFMKDCSEFEFLNNISLNDYYGKLDFGNQFNAVFERVWYLNPENPQEAVTVYSVYDNLNSLNQSLRRHRNAFPSISKGIFENKENLLSLPLNLLNEIIENDNLPTKHLDLLPLEIKTNLKDKPRSIFKKCTIHTFEILDEQTWIYEANNKRFFFKCSGEKLGRRLQAFLTSFLKVMQKIDSSLPKDVASFSSINHHFYMTWNLMAYFKAKNYLPSCQLIMPANEQIIAIENSNQLPHENIPTFSQNISPTTHIDEFNLEPTTASLNLMDSIFYSNTGLINPENSDDMEIFPNTFFENININYLEKTVENAYSFSDPTSTFDIEPFSPDSLYNSSTPIAEPLFIELEDERPQKKRRIN